MKAFKRFLRVAVTTVAGALLSKYQSDPRYLALTPVLSAVGAWLRQKYPEQTSGLPF